MARIARTYFAYAVTMARRNEQGDRTMVPAGTLIIREHGKRALPQRRGRLHRHPAQCASRFHDDLVRHLEAAPLREDAMTSAIPRYLAPAVRVQLCREAPAAERSRPLITTPSPPGSPSATCSRPSLRSGSSL